MNVFKRVFIGSLILLLANAWSFMGLGQDATRFEKDKLENLINSPVTKNKLADMMDVQPNIDFDLETLAYDSFRANVIVATIDFEHVPSGIHGTASFAYKWQDLDLVLIHSSYWLWGTVVSEDITTNTTWNPAGSPYYLISPITVQNGATLTIEPGTTVRVRKFNYGEGFSEIDVYGTLNCQNTTFTTSCDFESYDHSQFLFNETDWSGIYVMGDGSCTIEDSSIEYAAMGVYKLSTGSASITGSTIFRCYDGIDMRNTPGTYTIENNVITDCPIGIYCTSMTSALEIRGNTIHCDQTANVNSGIYCYESSPLITENTIYGYGYGIHCRVNSSPTVSTNTIQDNSTGIYCYQNSSPTVNNNNITGNTNYGLYNADSSLTVNAENNWWGDATGPYHPTTNPSGNGDRVSDYVDYDPWLTSAVTIPGIIKVL